jgi:hypothetical protein
MEKTSTLQQNLYELNKLMGFSKLGAETCIELGKGFVDETAMRPSRDRWSAKRMKETEEKYPKERILEAHKKCKTLTQVLEYLEIGHVETYLRLCEVYKIKPLKYDKTTKNGSSSKLTIVYKLIEDKSGMPEVYDSMKELKRIIGKKEVKGTMRTHNDDKITYLKKIKYCTDKDGRRIRIHYTGKQIPFIKSDGTISKRDWSKQVQVYELVEEFVGEFPSRAEVYRTIGDVAIRSVHKGNTDKSGGSWQSNGYRFYDLN